MVVVEDGRYFMDKQIEVEVTSALQTDAGRMIFARPLHSQRGIDEHTDHKENRNNKDKKIIKNGCEESFLTSSYFLNKKEAAREKAAS